MKARVRSREGEPDPVAKAVLGAMAFNCFRDDGVNSHPSIETLVEQTGYGERTVQRAIRRLISYRLIEVVQGSGGRGLPSVFNLDVGLIESLIPPKAQRELPLSNLRLLQQQQNGVPATPFQAQQNSVAESAKGDALTPFDQPKGVTQSRKGDALTPNLINSSMLPSSSSSAEAAAAVTPGDNKSRHSLDVRIRFAREKQSELSLRNPTGFAIRTLADGSRDSEIDAWLAAKRRLAEAARHQSERERIEYEARRAEAIALSLRGGEYSREELLILEAFQLKPKTEPATRTA